jgi:hypothetical protein
LEYLKRFGKTLLLPARIENSTMAKMMSCECGWTLISPMGEGDVKKHAMMHMADAHPGMKMTNDQMMKMIKSV